MPTKRHTVANLLGCLETAGIELESNDDQWDATLAADEPISRIYACSGDSIPEALNDLGVCIEEAIGELLIGQLSHYQMAVLLSSLRVKNGHYYQDPSVVQGIPRTASTRSLAMLEDIGLVGPVTGSGWCSYGCLGPKAPGASIEASGLGPTAWGKTVAFMLARDSRSDHPKVLAALGRLRMKGAA